MSPAAANNSDYPPVELIADLCFKQFESFPKPCLPTLYEWTVLAGVVLQVTPNAAATRVVALGVGTKCLGQDKLCSHGLLLNDSHAEVLARRALLRYFYQQMKLALQQEESIFSWNEETACFELKAGHNFHFFTTQTPCGDACIVPPPTGPAAKKRRVEEPDTVYTGAKRLGVPASEDAMQQDIGVVRLKPGRGSRTLSLSCSDKLARWNVLGVQGALLYALMLKPIYFSTINICNHTTDIVSLQRAIYKRFQRTSATAVFTHPGGFSAQQPQMRRLNPTPRRNFSAAQDEQHQLPYPNALVWIAIPEDDRCVTT